MDGTVARLHCRYRVLGEAAAAPALIRRLDAALRPRLAAQLGRSLDQALAGDPTVYCLRRVRSSIALALDADSEDDGLAEIWGERLAGSAVRTLAADSDDGVNLVRFADQADYVARFVSDLVEGGAWERWYYLAFRRLANKPRLEALLAVLLEHRDDLPAILGRLEERGRLPALLAALPARALDSLWLAGLAGRPAGQLASAAGRRALLAAAIALVEALGLAAISAARAGELLRVYRTTDGVEDDWSRPQELARGVARAFAFLLERRAVERGELAAAVDRVSSAVAPLEWLDRDGLAAAIRRLALAPPALRSPARSGPTPTQRQLFADLASAVRAVAGRLDRTVPDSPANALTLAAALYRLGERWRGEAMAVEVVERLLRAWAALAVSPRPDAVLGHLRRGESVPALAALGDVDDSRRRAVTRFAGLGAPALEALAALAGGGDEEAPGKRQTLGSRPSDASIHPVAGESEGIETPAAGLFLLLRALGDLRLPSLFERAAYPPLGCPSHGTAGVLALGLRWAGDRFPGRSRRGQPAPLDRGLALLAGLPEPPEPQRLHAAFAAAGAEDHDRFQRLLLAAAAGQRSSDGATLRLFSPGGEALVAQIGSGEGTGDLWPLGRIASETAERRRIVAGWLAAWEDTVGPPPAEATADAGLLDALTERAGWPSWTVVEEPAAGDESPHPHTAARSRLLAALDSLDAGRLAAPGADDGADLTLALTATVVLRVWARWLRRFADSSVPFLLERLVRRSGRVSDTPDALEVALDGRPLDLVLEMAGYLGTFESPWGRTVRFHRRSL